MRLYITVLLVCLFSFSLFSQNERINCIIFIDGKLPEGSWIYDEYFSYYDSLGNFNKIDFNYIIGEIQLTKNNAIRLNSLNPESKITMNFTHKKYNGDTFKYFGELKVKWLTYRYLVIRITNLNKRKGEYYFGYSTPGVIKKFIKKEYDMFEEYK